MIRIGIIHDTRRGRGPRVPRAWLGAAVFLGGLASLIAVGHARADLYPVEYPGGDPSEMSGIDWTLPTDLGASIYGREIQISNTFGPLDPPVADPSLTDLHVAPAWWTAGVGVALADGLGGFAPLALEQVVGPIEDEGGSVVLRVTLDASVAPPCDDDPLARCGSVILATDMNAAWGDTALNAGTEVYKFDVRTPQILAGDAVALLGDGVLAWSEAAGASLYEDGAVRLEPGEPITIDLGQTDIGEAVRYRLSVRDDSTGTPRVILDASAPPPEPWAVGGLGLLPYDLADGALGITVTLTPQAAGPVEPLTLILETDIDCPDYPNQGACSNAVSITFPGAGRVNPSRPLLVLRRALGGSAALWTPQFVAAPTTIGEACVEGDRAFDAQTADLYLCSPDGWLRLPTTQW